MKKLFFLSVVVLLPYLGFTQGIVKEFQVDGQTLGSNEQTAFFLSDRNEKITLLKFPRSMSFGKGHQVALVQFNVLSF